MGSVSRNVYSADCYSSTLGPTLAASCSSRSCACREAVDVATIDKINILQATMRAMELAVAAVQRSTGAGAALLVDGNRLPAGCDPACSRAVVGGDSKSFVIAAASIVAKVTRDRIMDQLHLAWPAYDFGQHKGYGVPKHLLALRQHGPCPEHRRTFAPVKSWYPLAKEDDDVSC